MALMHVKEGHIILTNTIFYTRQIRFIAAHSSYCIIHVLEVFSQNHIRLIYDKQILVL